VLVESEMAHEHLAFELERSLLALDTAAARGVLVRASKTEGWATVVEDVVVPALERIGVAWESGEIALSQYYMCGRMCEEVVLEMLPGRIAGEQVGGDKPRVAIVTLDDRHELGRRIVLASLSSCGIAVRDLGCATVEEVLPLVVQGGIELLLVSTLMLGAALRVKDLVERLRNAGAGTLVAVGGAPFRLDPLLWEEVGAFAMGRTAGDAAAIVREWRDAR